MNNLYREIPSEYFYSHCSQQISNHRIGIWFLVQNCIYNRPNLRGMY